MTQNSSGSELAVFAQAVIELGGFQPPVEQLPAIRGYLAEIQAAMELLPEVAAVDDPLDAGFDPSWPETEA